ncbi:MAG: hypothetical protein Fur0042_26500 [Cyanophyceae cyanobacterium]
MSSPSNQPLPLPSVPPVRGQVITGTVAGFVDQGDDFLLSTSGGALLIDPDSRRADQLGLALGETVQVRVDDLDDGFEVDTRAIARPNGTPILGQLTPNPTQPQGDRLQNLTSRPNLRWDALTGQWFNAQDYLNRFPDVARSNLPALQHFVNHGAIEGRDTTLFNEPFYLTQNPDVQLAQQAGAVRSGWEHFVFHGAAEGRLPTPLATPALVNNMAQTFQQIQASF